MEELLNKIAYFQLIELHTYLLCVYFYLLPIISTKWWDFPKRLVVLPFRGVPYFLIFKQIMTKASFAFAATKQDRK